MTAPNQKENTGKHGTTVDNSPENTPKGFTANLAGRYQAIKYMAEFLDEGPRPEIKDLIHLKKNMYMLLQCLKTTQKKLKTLLVGLCLRF